MKQLKGKEFTIKESGFDGHVEAVDPEKNIAVAIREFNLGNDLVTVKLKTSGRFELAGSIKQGETNVEVVAEIDLEMSVAAQAQLSLEGNDFFVQPRVNDLDISLEIKNLKPSNLTGGKELLAKIVNASFKSNKAKILEGLNKSLGKQKITL